MIDAKGGIGGSYSMYDYDYFVKKYVSNVSPNTIIVVGGNLNGR